MPVMVHVVSGLGLRGITALAVLGLVLGACTDDGAGVRNAAGEVVEPGDWSVFELENGDCLDPDAEVVGEVDQIRVVPCDQPHAQEVFASAELPEAPYPGAAAVARQADGACLGELDSSLGLTLADGLFVSYFLPTFVGWNREPPDRRVVCVLVFPDREAALGSVVAGTAELPEPSTVTPTTPETDGA